MKRLFIAYRDNALFSRYMPAFAEAMRADGWTIDRLVVAATASVEEAKENTRTFLSERSEPGYFISDQTCGVNLPTGNEVMDSSIRIQRYLDEIFRFIFSDQLKVTTYEEGFRKVLMTFCADRKIDTVHLVESNIGDHVDSGESSDSQQLGNEAESSTDGDFSAWVRYFADKFEGYIRSTLAGVKVERHRTYADAVKVCADDDNSLIIVDRHDETAPDFRQPKPPFWDRVYLLPPSSGAEDLIKAGKLELEFTPEQISKQLWPRGRPQ